MFEIIGTLDKQKRNETFESLRKTGNRLERKVIRSSEPVLLMNPKVPDEILLDSKGRARYTQMYIVAYPSN